MFMLRGVYGMVWREDEEKEWSESGGVRSVKEEVKVVSEEVCNFV